MKKYINSFVALTLILFSTLNIISQTHCDSLQGIVSNLLSENVNENSVYIHDGQVYKSLLNEEEVSEVKTTLFEGTTYRIAASAGIDDNFMIFEIYDEERNLLFTNSKYNNSPYWDFKIENTIDCTIETHLDLNKKLGGCTLMMIAFKKAK